jgi:hypothetical protein
MLIESYFCGLNVIYVALESNWIVILNILFSNNFPIIAVDLRKCYISLFYYVLSFV